jgi:uncharacterized protein YjeT (DUF2065 family)
MSKTRVSLLYLAYYLVIIGTGLLLLPHRTLEILQSSIDYGDVFPRVSGMLMSGLGLAVLRMIRAHSYELYPATITIGLYFIACIVAFYIMTRDPLFLVLLGIVGFGLVLTLGAYLFDRRSHRT